MSEGQMERMAAMAILDSSDPTRLTWKEIKDSWGTCSNFFYSYGLKPYNPEDWEEALAISRGIKGVDAEEEEEEEEEQERPKVRAVLSSKQNPNQKKQGGDSRQRSSQRKN